MLMTAAIRVGGRLKTLFGELLSRGIIRSSEGEIQEAVFCVTW